MQTIKKYLLVFLLLLPLCFAGSPADRAQPALLRLHVRAHSDAPADQALKYEVRNAVLAVLSPYLRQAENLEAAKAQIANNLPQVAAVAQQTVEAAGYNYPVTVSWGKAVFPTRLYGGKLYRAGTYQALQIYLGEGKGQNWWCVLFPPLCFIELPKEGGESSASVPAAGSTTEEIRPQCRSRLLEGLQKLYCKLITVWRAWREIRSNCN
ncbi:MAG: stage II sporulation protein R [Firmicutes bacterium]|nr:stage II sporulation protein R [Bacillota bacterium]